MSPKYFFFIVALMVFFISNGKNFDISKLNFYFRRLLSIILEVDALNCYHCGGLGNNCTSTSFGNQMQCNHAPLNSSCVKLWNGTEVTHRGCYISGFCTNNPYCSECDKDLCNASNTLILPLFLINTLIFLLFKLF